MTAPWPNGHRFAFTVFDDTDWATVENVKPVYDLLTALGMRTTKSVWMLPGTGRTVNAGATCANEDYLAWVLSLQRQGFEIGLHGAAPATSERANVRRALDRFRELFGDRMLVHCNHVGCDENLYWGEARFSGWRRTAYTLCTRGRQRDRSRGHVEGDPLFWGDLCRERVRYVRNFVFEELNTLAVCPEMPYHDPARPFVNFWFGSTSGMTVPVFLRNVTPEKIDRLADAGGLCILYVHFADRFARDGAAHPEVRRRLEYLASKDGWFAPVSAILDHLRAGATPHERAITARQRQRLETAWLADRIAGGVARIPERVRRRVRQPSR